MSSMDPTISWVLDRASTINANGESTVDLGTGERFSWAQTAQRIRSLSSALLSRGLNPSDRVGVLMLNSARHFELWFAIPGAGMVLNDLNFRLATEELKFICDDSQVSALFVDETFLPVGRELLEACDCLQELIWTGPGVESPDGTKAYEALVAHEIVDLPVAKSDDLAAIFYTGGTTGLPKGAMLTHRNVTSNALHMVACGQISPTDRYLHAGPQFHLADGALTYSLTWAGGTHVFIPAFEPSATVSALESEQVTITLLVPTMITMTLASGVLDNADLGSLRLLIYGASPMPAEIQRQAVAGFGCGMVQAYGMTEASPLVTWLDEQTHQRGIAGEEPFATRLRSAGAPIIGVRAEVRDADGAVVPPGTPGEIYIQGPNIMAGYWNRPEETEQALVDGWYRSGDVAYADEAGYLFVVDRAKDMIISGGENIYTSEVENAIYAHAGVAEAAVFGIPDPEWGERVHAEIVAKDGEELDGDTMIEHCRGRIAGYKVPRSVSIRSFDNPLPKSGAGKILKRDLRAPYWANKERNV